MKNCQVFAQIFSIMQKEKSSLREESPFGLHCFQGHNSVVHSRGRIAFHMDYVFPALYCHAQNWMYWLLSFVLQFICYSVCSAKSTFPTSMSPCGVNDILFPCLFCFVCGANMSV